MSLTAKDKQYIADTVTAAITATLKPIVPSNDAEPAPVEVKQQDTDPIMKHVDEKIAAIVKDLPTGNIILRGRRGSQLINQSEESLNTIAELLKDRKHYRTRARVG